MARALWRRAAPAPALSHPRAFTPVPERLSTATMPEAMMDVPLRPSNLPAPHVNGPEGGTNRRKKNRPGRCRAGLPCETSRAPKAWPFIAGFGSPPPSCCLDFFGAPDPSKLRRVRSGEVGPPAPSPVCDKRLARAVRSFNFAPKPLCKSLPQCCGNTKARRGFFWFSLYINMLLVTARGLGGRFRRAIPPSAEQKWRFGPANFVVPCCSSATPHFRPR